ncbi:MAG: transglycosylase SLT domain-containing protein [Deltaproteobacteria bacterium]|nr:transglycosylase SLT domain-containing protein [Deltaproteobacteria bacterium]
MKKSLTIFLLLALLFFSPTLHAGLKEAYEAFQNKNYSSAMMQAQQGAIPANLQDYPLWILGKSALEQKDWPVAQKNLENLTKNHPASLFWQRAVVSLGRVYWEQKQSQKAKEYLSTQLGKLTKDARGEALYYLGKSETELGENVAAQAYLKEAYVSYPNALSFLNEDVSLLIPELTAEEYKQRGDALFEVKNFFGAERAYQKSSLTEAKIKRGRALYALKKYSEAIPLLNEATQAMLDEENALALIDLGQANEKLGFKSEADAIYQEIEKKYPTSPQAAEACYRRAKQNGEAASSEVLKSCVRKGFKNDLRDKLLWQVAWASYENKQYGQAQEFLKDLQEGASDFPTQAKAAYWYARSFEKMNENKKASEAFVQASELAPFTYYGFLALKKVQNLGSFQVAPKMPAGWKQGLLNNWPGNTEKITRKNIRVQKIETLYDNDMGRWFRDELNFAIDEAKANPEVLKTFLAQSKSSAAPFLKVLIAQKYWDNFRPLFASPRAAEDARNSLQFPFPFKKEIEKAAGEFALEPQLIVGLMRQESAFQPWVTSSANAQGLMQLLPATARSRAKAAGFVLGNLFNPADNIQAGSAELSALLVRFSNNWVYAIAGYNAGPGRPPQWAAQFPGLDSDEFVEEIPFSETNLYVKLVLRNYWSYKNLY